MTKLQDREWALQPGSQFLKGGEDPATDLIALPTTDPGAMALNGSS